MIRIIVAGIAGKMGSTIARRVIADNELKLTGALECKKHPWTGKDAGRMLGAGETGVRVMDRLEKINGDVIIDFTKPEATIELLKYAAKQEIPVVIGTTGFENSDRVKIKKTSVELPILLSPNMSIGMNLLFVMLEKAARTLGDEYDVEILEAHHRHKKDAPSGTAMAIGETIARALRRNFGDVVVHQRKGQVGERKKGEIGMQVIRAGDIVGDHTVLFATEGERIEFTHRVTSRENFARGAIRAAKWIHGKKPGLYSMRDVLGL